MKVRESMRYLSFCLIAFPLLLPAQTPEPTIRTTTSEVLLDFEVRDKHANIIRNLRPDEVQIIEDGVPQTLRHFEFYDGGAGTPAPEPAAPAAAAEILPAAATASKAPSVPMTVNELRDISVVSVVINNLDPRGRALTVNVMRQFVKNELTPNTYVGVFRLDPDGLDVLQPYTNDGEKISAAVTQGATAASAGLFQGIGLETALDFEGFEFSDFGPQGLPVGPMPSGAAMTDLRWTNAVEDAYQSSINTLTPLRELVAAQAENPGRKVVLLFMSGLPMSGMTTELLQSIISVANRANVTIDAYTGIMGYGSNNGARRALQAAANASMQQQLAGVNGGDQTVSPTSIVAMDLAGDSIVGNPVGNIASLAESTGGALLQPSPDMTVPLHKAMEGVRKHYELTYSPANTSLDGSYRKIEVKVTRPGATVFARNGYYAVPLVNGRQVYPFEVATLKAINMKPDLHQFDFHTTTLEFRHGAVRNQYAFVYQAPTKDLTVATDEKWAKVHVCVTALIKDGKGEVVDKISKGIPYEVPLAKRAELDKGTVSFTAPFFLPPGHYAIDTASVDRQSMKASVSRATLDVEQDSGFAMSDVSLARRVDTVQGTANAFDPLEAHGGKVTPDLSDTPAPDANGNLKFYAVAYPSAAADAPVAMKIELWRDGQLALQSPESQVPMDASGAASALASVPTAKLPPGHYQAQVSFEYKGQKVEKRVVFNLAGAS